jgi:DMSO/TMAO reductase YedYZ molybdopterin-dependent catalytic subunit
MVPATASKRSTTALGVVAGLVAAIVALGVAELLAGLKPNWKSPVLDVGDRVVDRVPPSVKDFAIEQFGTNDKLALLVGIGVFLALYAAVIGAIAFRRRIVVGVVGIAAFGLIGAYAALTRRVGGSADEAIPSIIGAVTGAAALWLGHRTLRPILATSPQLAKKPDESSSGSSPDPDVDRGRGASRGAHPGREHPIPQIDRKQAAPSRRQVLAQGGGLLALLALAGSGAGALGRSLKSRFSAGESRANVRLPAPAERLPSPPAGVSVDVDGMSPFVTPNADFYRIDTALTVPQLPTEDYELRVTGMVDRELSFSFDELLARDVVEHDITLTCVSNTVGGNRVGNARWLGIRLDDLLAEAGVQAGADQVVGRSIDGYTCGFPLEAATDGRNAMVAFGKNGEPLPLEHGFPARLVVPGVYGYVSATKWLVEI